MQAFATWMSLVLVYAGASLFYPATFNAGPEVFLDTIGVVLSLSVIVVF
jgi:hypothetical protein